MIKDLWGEKWVDLNVNNMSSRVEYKISNHGRVKSFVVDKENGQLIKPCLVGGYPAIRVRLKESKHKTMYIHRLVAEHFLSKESESHNYVIHIDYDKENNRSGNLEWATKSEMMQHQIKSPIRIASLRGSRRNKKLTESKVILLKKKLADPNRKTRMKILARQFGISEMQLYRIKNGNNWGTVNP
ncbi:MAG: HNH endonuclease [Bacteroidales bacterium]|nr:HNH endonuclease [Bacteroidales bacterium]